MSDICGRCGKQATGFATATVGGVERRYCHGDDDVSPTCYEMHSWPDEGTTTTISLTTDEVKVWRGIFRHIRENQA